MNELIKFLEANLRNNLDPKRYANGLLESAVSDSFEIRGFHTKNGVPVEANFSDFGIEL